MPSEAATRRIADLVRLSLVLGVPLLAFAGRGDGAYGMALVAVMTVVVRAARAPAAIELAFVSLAALDAWLTSVGAFATVNHQDHLGHLLLPAAVTPLLFSLAVRTGALRENAPGRLAMGARLAVALSLTIALGTAWELIEWVSDQTFGTQMSLGYSDTLGDLLADACGAVLGAIATVVLGTRRARQTPEEAPTAP